MDKFFNQPQEKIEEYLTTLPNIATLEKNGQKLWYIRGKKFNPEELNNGAIYRNGSYPFRPLSRHINTCSPKNKKCITVECGIVDGSVTNSTENTTDKSSTQSNGAAHTSDQPIENTQP